MRSRATVVLALGLAQALLYGCDESPDSEESGLDGGSLSPDGGSPSGAGAVDGGDAGIGGQDASSSGAAEDEGLCAPIAFEGPTFESGTVLVEPLPTFATRRVEPGIYDLVEARMYIHSSSHEQSCRSLVETEDEGPWQGALEVTEVDGGYRLHFATRYASGETYSDLFRVTSDLAPLAGDSCTADRTPEGETWIEWEYWMPEDLSPYDIFMDGDSLYDLIPASTGVQDEVYCTYLDRYTRRR